jgi:hypothetical protein
LAHIPGQIRHKKGGRKKTTRNKKRDRIIGKSYGLPSFIKPQNSPPGRMASAPKYDDLAVFKRDFKERDENPLSHQIKFNNWLKSILIKIGIPERSAHGFIISYFFFALLIFVSCLLVLELGIGRGGDLGKLVHSDIASLTGVDNSFASLEECRGRYNSSAQPHRSTYQTAYQFPLTLYYGDFGTQSFSSLFDHPMHFVSCQFSMHYSFCSGEAANQFFRTVSAALSPGYSFAATFPNAVTIVFVYVLIDRPCVFASSSLLCFSTRKNLETSPSRRFFGNRFFCVTFDRPYFPRFLFSPTSLPSSLLSVSSYGARYRFRLDTAVDSDEFLIHPAMLEKFTPFT